VSMSKSRLHQFRTCTDPIAPWRQLGCAILLRAVKDAKSANGHSHDARRFLAGPGRDLVSALGMDAGGVDDLLAGLPEPVQMELDLGE